MQNKKVDTEISLHEIIANRWSPRAFDVSKFVSQEKLQSLLEAARWAPSCYNDQPWRFIIFDKANNEAAWKNALSVLAEPNQVWAKNAPLLILVIAANKFSHNGKINRWSHYDTGAAALNLVLQADSSGLVSHQMGGFDEDVARSLFEIPQDYTLMSMLAIGYQAEESVLSGDFKTMEVSDRQRNDIGEIVFNSKWGGV